MPRPGAAAVAPAPAAPASVVVAASSAHPLSGLRPRPRPAHPVAAPPVPEATPATAAAAPPARPERRGLFGFLRPRERQAAPPAGSPGNVQQTAIIRPAPGTGPVTGRAGSVCGNPAIRGETVAPVVGRIRGCGIEKPVRVSAVGGIALSQGALMDCPTAQALHRWVENGVKPAFGATGGGVVKMQVAAHYVCRGRNNKKGAKLSEHAKGKAIDISAFVLADGTTLTVLRDWRGNRGRPIRAAHKAACGPFGTTLGPGSDGYHEDHLHLDSASYRNGPYCR
ncbi:extensin family protein [Ruixingdingia sedimenti]|uniref:Extensin family protein n=1 Tax=Ruixingdingia sedimenti TaxID=3073604 RepID=A0ABU1FDF1_9RHOB|nr:extensin family protein [Xinfangfangia sp. LG-4]MDR5654918.1 extensin family protein [Xinfangfangia sp. LG-4]